MANAAEILKKAQKSYGDEIGIEYTQDEFEEVERIPFGIFELDVMTGGGVPRGRVTVLYGPESSGKTNHALRVIANHQRKFPDLVCVFVDVEDHFDPKWAKILGVDVAKLIVIKPDYAEQVVDIVESFLLAEDIGLVVIDSLAAMMTKNEMDSSAEKAVVGGAGLAISKLIRKTTGAMKTAKKQNRCPTLIYINQIRHKIGVMYGDPETMPGGNGPKFQSSLTLRFYGSSKIDPKVNKVLPAYKETTAMVKKFKIPIVAIQAKYDLMMVPGYGLKPGQTQCFNDFKTYSEKLGFLTKGEKKGWVFFGQEYPTLEPIKELLYNDPDIVEAMTRDIVEKLRENGDLLEEVSS